MEETIYKKITYSTPVGTFGEIVLENERSLRLVLTGRCNLSCEFCAYKLRDFYSPEIHSSEFAEMKPIDELREVLETMKEKLNYDISHFTGGEPTVAEHLFEIAKLCSEEGYSNTICTNMILKEPIERLLSKELLAEVTFSYEPPKHSEECGRESERNKRVLRNVSEIRYEYPDAIIKTNIIISPHSDLETTKSFVEWCWENEVIVRAQRDRYLSRIEGSTKRTLEFLNKLEMEPVNVTIRVPGATEICKFENDGNEIYVKIFNKNFRPKEICKDCDEVKSCEKSLSSIRVYNTNNNEILLNFCTKKYDESTNLTLHEFLSHPVFEEIKRYKENKLLYFDIFCRNPNFQ